MWFELQQGQEIFSKTPRSVPEFTQPPIQSVPEVKGLGHGADLRLLLRLRMSGSMPPLHVPSWRRHGQLYCP